MNYLLQKSAIEHRTSKYRETDAAQLEGGGLWPHKNPVAAEAVGAFGDINTVG